MHMFNMSTSICNLVISPFWFRGQDLGSDCISSSSLFSFFHDGANIYIEPRYEKTGLPGFRPGSTATKLYSH